MQFGAVLLLLSLSSALGAVFNSKAVHPVFLEQAHGQDGENLESIGSRDEDDFGLANMFIPLARFESMINEQAARFFQESQLEASSKSEMLDRVAASRLSSAMKDLETVKAMDFFTDYTDGWSVWDPEYAEDMFLNEEPADQFISNLLMAPFDLIWKSLGPGLNDMVTPSSELEEERERELHDAETSGASGVDISSSGSSSEAMEPETARYNVFNADEEDSSQFNKMAFFIHDMDSLPRLNAYDTDAALQRLAYEQWLREQQVEESRRSGTRTALRVGTLMVLLVAMAMMLVSFLSSWSKLKGAMAESSVARDPDLVAVMFEHNGRLVRGWMSRRDIGKDQDKSAQKAVSLEVAGAKNLKDIDMV